MKLIIKDSSEYIPTKEAIKLSNYTLKAIRDWCIKNKSKGLAYKHANKWYLHKPSYLKWLAEN